MDTLSDQQLLRDYAERRSESAFAELVRRHIDLVYSAALRMVCDTHLAEDVAQGAFIALAQNARALTERPVLSGWLHRTAQNLAANVVRSDVRRRAWEQEAAVMNELLSANSDATWQEIAPHLDAALATLSEPDRDALLLRYFERKSAHEIAQRFGISDEAAQKRVSRAVERLREFFSKRGVTIGAGALAAAISANAVHAAPLALSAAVSAACLASTSVPSSTAAAATKIIAMTTLQKTLLTATVAILAGAGIHLGIQASHLREQNHALQQQRAPLARSIEQLTRDQNSLSNQLAAALDDNDHLKSNAAELLQLRGEVAALRRQTKDPVAAEVTPQSAKSGASPFVPSEEFANAGLASPEATAKTFAWAARNKDKEMIAKIVDADKMPGIMHQMMHRLHPDSPDSAFTEDTNSFFVNFENQKAALQGYQIMSQQFRSTNKVALQIAFYLADGSSDITPLNLQLVDGEWKFDFFAPSLETIPVTISTQQPDGSTTNTIVHFTKQEEQILVPVPENTTNP